ncbi:MAG: YfhO family protein [Lachnospiraceae bacterium]|nr:YfhO family protein [Lachnospiraceae bacterium]
MKQRILKIKPYIYTFLLAALIISLGMYLSGILPGGRYTAVNTDTMDQMASLSAMLARQLQNGDNPFYSWETSMGQNTALLYAFCAYSPMTLLYVLFSDIYFATMLGIILKIALAAMFFHIFLEKGLGWKGQWNTFFALCYGLCGFQMEYMLSTNLLDGLYLLPMVMWALIRGIKKERFSALAVAYAITFVVQFYCGFLIGMCSVIGMFLFFCLRDGKKFLWINRKLLVRYAVCVVSAICLSMCMLFPAICFFRASTGFNSVLIRGIISPFDLLYSMYFGRPTSLVTDIPFLYCGLPVVLLLPLYFCNTKIQKAERIIMGISVMSIALTLYLDPLYFFLHAFNRPDGFTVRYAFCYVFLLVLLTARAVYQDSFKVLWQKKGIGLTYATIQLIIAALIIIWHDRFGEFADGKGVKFGLIGSSILILLWCLIGYLLKKFGNDRKIVCAAYVLVCIELSAQSYFNGCEQGRVPSENAVAWEEQMDAFLDLMHADAAPDRFFRAHAGNAPYANQSAMYGYPGIGQFASSNYTNLYKLMSRLGDSVNGVRYNQTGATDTTDMLFGIRYRTYLYRADEVRQRQPEIYKRALPIGYMASPYILNPIPFTGNAFENQNQLVSALCGATVQVYRPAEVIAHQEENALYETTESGYRIRTIDGSTYGDVLFGIPAGDELHAYAYFQLLPYRGETGEVHFPETMASEISVFSPDDRKGSGARFENVLGNAIIEMSRDEDAFLLRVADFDGPEKSYDYVEQYFVYQDEYILDQVYEYLNAGRWEIAEYGSDYIKARIHASDDKPVLFLSIPYDSGWRVKVDDIESEIIPVAMDAFMAVPVTSGDHLIEMHYETPGLREGKMLMVIGGLILLLMLVSERKRKENERNASVDNRDF